MTNKKNISNTTKQIKKIQKDIENLMSKNLDNKYFHYLIASKHYLGSFLISNIIESNNENNSRQKI